ncbi:MAG: hypothetical protein H6828_07285 [Planctomycetes bacterium]|nr:hypothetical protein [Planctomycetota bacterium]
MKARPELLRTPSEAPQAGSDIRQRVEHLGTQLAETLGVVLSEVPNRGAGPQMLANVLGITVATASRLLKALSQDRAVAVLQLLPGPKPLTRIVESALEHGVSQSTADAALAAIAEFDEMIRTEAGDRSGLKAMLSVWLPDERREFEAARRQSIFKAMTELDGVSCDLDLCTMILSPGAQDGRLDLVNLKALLGIDRIRPDAVVKLGTHALNLTAPDAPTSVPQRHAETLDGEPAIDGLHSVRLDEYCSARPAPLEARQYGQHMQYSLGPTGFGPASSVDLVLVEVNCDEVPVRQIGVDWQRPYFFQIPEMAVRLLVFDLMVHKSVYPTYPLELLGFDTAGRGPASVNDPTRELDRRRIYDDITPLGEGLQRMRLLEFPRYTELLRSAMQKRGLDAQDFRSYRVKIPFPLMGTQITLAFDEPED